MKFKLLLLSLAVIFSVSCSAQSFFNPLPKPSHLAAGKFGLAADSVQTSIRPVLNISATFSDGTSLAGGAGLGVQHNKWDVTSQTWVTQWSVSAIGFLGTNGTKISGTAAVVFGIPGTNGLVNIGPGYNVTNGVWVLATGAIIKFN